jgi:outer membrane receptor protein involved in Fe transport
MRHIWGDCVARLCAPRLSDLEANRSRILGRAKPIRTHNVLYLFALLVFLPSIVSAQVNTGTLTGTVKDTSGAVVPDAMVTVRNTATGATRVVQTASDGVYTVPGLAPTLYDVTVSKTGFADYKTQATITVGSHVTLDAALSVSQVSTTVEVVAVAGGGAEINTQNAEISQIVTPDQVANLPSLTRNPYDFVALSGNISGADRSVSSGNPQLNGSGQNGTDRGVGFSLNGQRSSGTEILLDGAENTNVFDTSVGLLIPQDAVQEFRIITNNFDAQYGRAAGGVVNVITKSGTDNFHGDAWEYNRLSAYTANTFTNNANSVPKGQYTRNQFGYDVGGPIKKDKLFFYQSTEWLRVRSAANLTSYVPTPQMLALMPANVQAFFSTLGNNTFNFLSTVPAGQVAFSAADCAGQKAPAANCGLFLTNVPAATPAFGLVGFTAPVDAGGDAPQNTYELVGRFDYNFTNNTQMYFRYGRESLVAIGSQFVGPYSQYNVGQSIYNNNFLLSVSHTFSSNLLTTTKLSFFRDDGANQFNTALQETPTLFLYNNATINGQSVQLPGFSDFTTGTGGLPFGGPQNTLQIGEDVSWSKGKHNMKYGGEYTYIQLNRGFGAYAQANEQLGSSRGKGLDNMALGVLTNFQRAVNPAGQLPCFTGPYTGAATPPSIITPQCTLNFPVTEPSFNRSYRYNDWAIYAEDSWRVTPRLTFNYGLRYEHYGVQHNNNPNLDSNLYYGPGANIFQQINTAQIFTVPNSPIKGLWKPRWGTAGPRIGFAYDVFGDGKTSLRGGYGITYERNFGNVTFNMIQNPPNNATVGISGGVAQVSVSNLGPFAGATCPTLPAKPCSLPPVSPRNVAQDIQVAETQFWGVSIERQLGNKALAAIEYSGSHGVHLYDLTNVNEIGDGQVYLGQSAVGGLNRANNQFTSINNRGSRAFSHYNAVNVKFQTQEVGRTGITLQTNYTYAHALDNLSSTFSENSTGSNGVGNLGYTNVADVWLDYGNSDFDIRHRLALSATWQEPFLKNRKGFLRQAGGGWSISPIFTARTGVPFSIADSSNSLNAQTGPYGIPRYVPSAPITSFHAGTPVDSGSANLFNLLTLPTANSYKGLLGISDFGPYPAAMTSRNAFYGPGAWSFDLALAKSFFLTERFSLEFRAEGYDIFNHTNMYVNGFGLDVALFPTGAPVIQGLKGGLGNTANNGQHDERRFGQFALRLHF